MKCSSDCISLDQCFCKVIRVAFGLANYSTVYAHVPTLVLHHNWTLTRKMKPFCHQENMKLSIDLGV